MAAPRHEGRFADATAPRVDSTNEADVSDKPAWIRARARLTAQQLADQDEIARGRLRTLLALDELIAGLVAALEASGKLDNTYVFLTSDHGYRIGGEHRLRHGKQTPYDEDLRVPFLVRGPRVSAGRTVEQLCVLNDLMPTVLELAGVGLPAEVDGRSLVPLFSAATTPATWRSAFLAQHWTSAQDQGIPEWRALRTATRLYVEWPPSAFSAAQEVETYDLTTDPRALSSDHARLGASSLSTFSSRLGELTRCSGATCRSAEDAGL